MDREELWCEELGTVRYRMTVSWVTRSVKLYLGGPCDMTGAVTLAESVLPGVAVVFTFVEEEPDTVYRKAGGEWRAYTRGGV